MGASDTGGAPLRAAGPDGALRPRSGRVSPFIGIVLNCQVESPLVCVSGVTGSNLWGRVEDIMNYRVLPGLNPAKRLLLTSVGVAAVALPIFIGAMHAPRLRAQPQPGKRLTFEVASIRRNV